MSDWFIYIFSHMGSKAVIHDLVGLFQSWHAFLDFDINASAMLYRLQVVLVFNILRDG